MNLITLARTIQAAGRGKIAITLKGMRIADLEAKRLRGINLNQASLKQASSLLSQIAELPLRPGNYPLEVLLPLYKKNKSAEKTLEALYRSHLPFVSEALVERIEARALKVYLLGSAGTGVVSAVQDLVTAFVSAGYYGRAFPLFDPSKKGAPVKGYGVISRDPILNHSTFAVPDIILLFDQKLFSLLTLNDYQKWADPREIAILVNTPLDPVAFCQAANLKVPFRLHTLDADSLVRSRHIPPNYAMMGGMLGVMTGIDTKGFVQVVQKSLTDKFGAGVKVDANVEAMTEAERQVRGESKKLYAGLGPVKPVSVPAGQAVLCEDGNKAIARAMALVLNQFPSVVAAYPITPQTQIVEYLAQMMADGTLSAEGVTPESEHGAGGAVLGAARDRVLAFTATCSQGFALMSEIVHTIGGLRMGNVMISNVVRSLNSPLDVENDHSDLNKIGLDAGFIVLMTRDVQQAFDFHLMGYLLSLYAEYRPVSGGGLEMIPDRSIMLPIIVASEGFEVSHAPERYLVMNTARVEEFYRDPAFDYLRTFVNTPNRSIMGALQLSNARMETDYQRHEAMNLALEVLPKIFARFEKLTGRSYDFVHSYNVASASVIFVVAGAAYGTFEEVAREFHREGIEVGVVHPNVLRPFPKKAWIPLLKDKRVFVYDRDDPYGAVGGRLYTELAGVVNEYELETCLYSRIYGLGGRTPSLALVRDEILKALKDAAGEVELSRAKHYVGVSL